MEKNRDVPLYDLAFALARREALRERAAVIANSREECIELLHRILEESIREGKTFCASCYPSTEYRIAHPGEVMEELAVNWVTGINYQWDGFFDKGVLPLFLQGYVFEEEYCWSQNSAFKPDRKEVTGENAVKSEIVTIFSRVLRIPADKIEDNKPFHEFGLDSLKAMDILRLLNDRFTAEIPLKELFRNNTIASLLSYLKNQENFLKTKSTNYLKLESGYHVNASFFSTIEKMVLTGMREKKITVEQGLEIKAYILNLVKEG
jgi:acyl carrier protein